MPANQNGPLDFRVGDVLRMRKAHPCGGFEWSVLRIGGDIGVKCQTCGRRLMLPRRELERRVKSFVLRGPDVAENVVLDAPGAGE